MGEDAQTARAYAPTVVELASYGPYGRDAALPNHWEQLSAQWFTSVLQNKYPGIVVEAFESIEVRSTHTTKVRVAVEFNDVGRAAGLPGQLCLKANFTGRANPVDICLMEARFYHDLVEGRAVPTPVSYYSDWDEDGSGQGLAVLEDLIELGGEFGTSYQHIGVDAVGSALDDMAVLHGRYWADPSLATASWLPESMNTRVDCDQARIMLWLVEENMAREIFIDRLPKWMLEDRSRFLRAYDLLSEYARAQQGPPTIVHGDAYLGNTYLKPDGHRIWLDWQMVRKGHPWRDISYFMLGALTTDERRASERDLLERYRTALLATGAVDVPSAEAIWQQYRRWPMYGLQSWLGTKDHWGQDNHTMIERFVAAAEDLDTLTLLEAQLD